MRINIEADLVYAIEEPSDLLVQIEVADLPDQEILSDHFDPTDAKSRSRISAEDGIGTRIWLHCDTRFHCRYTAQVHVTRPARTLDNLPSDPVHKLPHEAVRYLMASRYCPSDEFQSFVSAEFGRYRGGTCVRRMADWIRDHFTYSPGASGPQTTALDTFVQRRGICRDFAHVLITLVRARGIPARMVSAYGPDVDPPDFHAVVQVWLKGQWYIVDPSGMSGPERLAIIGVGRDAADISFLTSYGWVALQSQTVSVTEA